MRKNILFIFTDQWRGDCLGCAGHPDVLTPNLDALAQDGVLFRGACAAAPSCIPARACVATGKTPLHTGFVGYEDGIVWDYPQTMMTRLRAGGYQTINVGKTHFYPQRAHLGFEINKMYDAGKIEPTFKSDYHQWLEKASHGQVTDTANSFDGNSCLYYPWMAEEYLHPTAWNTSTAIECLENRDNTRPFYMQVTYHRPHPPYDPPRDFFDLYRDEALAPIPYGDWCGKFDVPNREINSWYGHKSQRSLDLMRKAYYASISHIDYHIGRLITWLKCHGLYQDTLIVFSSDHGELLGDHHLYRKITPFEGAARIPWIVKGDGSCRKGEENRIPVSHFDLMPTFLDFAGLPIPEDVDGVSLMPAMRSGTVPERKLLHGEHAGYGDNGWQFLWDERYKYIWNTRTGEEYFFDLKHDPQELHNLAGEEALVSPWRQKLAEILSQRPEDGLTESGHLKPGKILNPVRPDFRENSNRLKKEYGLMK